jgi:molecular chaperone DnaK
MLGLKITVCCVVLFFVSLFFAGFTTGETTESVIADDMCDKTPSGQGKTEAVAVGIDLGTCFSCVAAVVDGKPEVILNAEGETITPSVVAYTMEKELLVGLPAKRQALTNPRNTFSSVKRFMGCRSQEVSDKMKGGLSYDLDLSGTKVGVLCPAIGESLSPEKVSALVLRKLVEDASAYLGAAVRRAVITVPAYFNASERQATRDAARIAGIEVLRIVNEPTASCIHFGFQKGSQDQTVLVYDLGGGTFDVSVLEVGEGLFEVLATSGDTRLGGDDFDGVIAQYLAGEFQAQEGVDLLKEDNGLERLMEAAERAKRDLSSLSLASVNIPFVWVSPDGIPKHMLIDLERENFESQCSELLERCRLPLLSVVESSDLEGGMGSIDQVVLVGGSTRMPMIKSLVEEATGKVPSQGVNPDHSVALGAAIQADSLTNEGAVQTLLLDVTPISLGIEVGVERVMRVLIARNSPIPTRASEVFSNAQDGQPSVTIHILQGEREIATANKSLGNFVLPVRPAPAGMSSVRVTFDIDVDGLLVVTAKDEDTGEEGTITVTGASNLDEEEVKALIDDFERNSGRDREVLNEARVRERFTKTCRKIRESKDLKEEAVKRADDLILEIQSLLGLKSWGEAQAKISQLEAILT